MKVDVTMPKMGESVTEGTIIKWYKQKGDTVEVDETLFEISTDKVDTEIPSPEAGTVVDIKVYENETVEVGTLVAVIETDGEAAAEDSQKQEEEKEAEPKSTTQVGGAMEEITMPKMGESVTEGTVIKWHKQVGDEIEVDETLFEISTDKVDTEIPSPVAGTLAEILVNENDTVEVGTVVAKISTSGGIVQPKEETKPEETEEEFVPAQKYVHSQTSQKPDTSGSNRFYSPVVLNIAQAENISFEELETIQGTGTNGRVSKKDVLNYLEDRKSGKSQTSQRQQPAQSQQPSAPRRPEAQPLQQTDSMPPSFERGEGTEVVPMDNIRKRIMDHMVNSRDTSVHVTAIIEVDMSKIHNYIQSNKENFKNTEGVKLTYMPFISYACIKALKEYPYVNASIDGSNIVVKKFINLGIAVAVEPNGLIVPNIKAADEKNIRGLAKAINSLSQKSRGKGLMPDDIMNGTFSITNYGVFGSLFGTPIINQPEVGILGVGAVQKKPVVVEVNGMDTIAVKPMMYLSLSHDHRLVDGMLGGKFLKSIKDTLENFDTNIV